jgi:hypothetical protein
LAFVQLVLAYRDKVVGVFAFSCAASAGKRIGDRKVGI